MRVVKALYFFLAIVVIASQELTIGSSNSSGGQAPQSSRYSLRGRNVDSETQLRRDELKEGEREIERRIQTKRLKKGQEIKDRGHVAGILKLKATIHAQYDLWEKEQEKLRLSGDNNGGDFSGKKGESETVYTC